MAGIESGERVTADLEIRKAEAQGNWGIGILNRTAEDPLRAIGRATSPVINALMLASVVALTQQGSIAAVEEGSFMAEVLRSLREKLPLPSPPIPWLRDDLVTWFAQSNASLQRGPYLAFAVVSAAVAFTRIFTLNGTTQSSL